MVTVGTVGTVARSDKDVNKALNNVDVRVTFNYVHSLRQESKA